MELPQRLVIAGIGTDVGKTVVSAALCASLQCDYWKPVQCGFLPETDTAFVRRLSGLPAQHFHPERHSLETPASPHYAAQLAGIAIRLEDFEIPKTSNRLLIEMAGGLMVPLSNTLLSIDLLAHWALPVVLVVRYYLGSINHSLLSLEALKLRGIPLAGIVLNGGDTPSSEVPILAAANAPLLARLPEMGTLSTASLKAALQSDYF